MEIILIIFTLNPGSSTRLHFRSAIKWIRGKIKTRTIHTDIRQVFGKNVHERRCRTRYTNKSYAAQNTKMK